MVRPGAADRDRGPLVDFRRLAGRIGVAALVLGALAFLGVVVEGLTRGLTFALMLRWAAAFLAALLLATAVLAAASALRGAGRARERGERMASGDAKLLPQRRPDG
jgi:hypothetical protein